MKMKSLLRKPAIGGMPASASRQSDIPAASHGARRPKPSKSRTLSRPVASPSAMIPAKTPILVTT